MRSTSFWDWCVNGLWLGLAVALFFAALSPVESAGNASGCAGLRVELKPSRPLPGQTVQVRIGVLPAGFAPRAGCSGYPKQVSVDAGQLSALQRSKPGAPPVRVSGRELAGDLSCIRWTVPDGTEPARLSVSVEGQTAELVLSPGAPEPVPLAASLKWLHPMMNLAHRLGVRYW